MHFTESLKWNLEVFILPITLLALDTVNDFLLEDGIQVSFILVGEIIIIGLFECDSCSFKNQNTMKMIQMMLFRSYRTVNVWADMIQKKYLEIEFALQDIIGGLAGEERMYNKLTDIFEINPQSYI